MLCTLGYLYIDDDHLIGSETTYIVINFGREAGKYLVSVASVID